MKPKLFKLKQLGEYYDYEDEMNDIITRQRDDLETLPHEDTRTLLRFIGDRRGVRP